MKVVVKVSCRGVGVFLILYFIFLRGRGKFSFYGLLPPSLLNGDLIALVKSS